MEQLSDYKKTTWLGDECSISLGSHCEDCDEYGFCDSCNSFEGRNMEAIFDYASTCDGCMVLTHYQGMSMDPQTQLRYCDECLEKITPVIRERIEQFEKDDCPDEAINPDPIPKDPDVVHYQPTIPVLASSLIPG